MDTQQIVSLIGCCLCCPFFSPCWLGGIISNNKWRAAKIKKIEASSEVITTPLGQIEFSKKGNAPYILAIHGCPGLHDGDQGMYDDWLEHGFGVIAPSRPGYGRSTLLETADLAADQYAHLLDALKVDKVAAIFGISGGGPSTCRFAAKYGNRTSCLLTEVAVTGNFSPPDADQVNSIVTKLYMTNITMARIAESQGAIKMIPDMLKAVSTVDAAKQAQSAKEIEADPKKMKYMELGVTAAAEVPCYPHHFRAMATEVPTWTGDFGLSEIKVPTFIVHGDSDKMVGNKNAENLHAAVEGSKYLKVEDGNHCIPLHTDAAKILQQQVDFVKEHHK